MLPASSTYLPRGASPGGFAPPKSTGGASGIAAGSGSPAAAGSGGRGASRPRWGGVAAEHRAPTPGLTFGFTLRRARRNMAEPGGPGRRPTAALSPEPRPLREEGEARRLPAKPRAGPAGSYRRFAPPPPPAASRRRLFLMTLLRSEEGFPLHLAPRPCKAPKPTASSASAAR